MKIKEIKEDIIFEIKYSYEKHIEEPYCSFIDGIKNFWTYRSLIWNDRWWDHYYLNRFIVRKLETMIDNWDDAHYVGSDFTKKRMIIIKDRIEKYDDIKHELEYDYIVRKKYTNEQYKDEIKKLNNKTWGEFGRNIRRFWD